MATADDLEKSSPPVGGNNIAMGTRLSHWPGQVPSRHALELRRLAEQKPRTMTAELLTAHTGPVLTPDRIVHNLGMNAQQELQWARFLESATNGAPNEIVLRHSLFQKMQEERLDPALRNAIFQRAMQYARDNMRKSIEVYTPDELKKALTPVPGKGGKDLKQVTATCTESGAKQVATLLEKVKAKGNPGHSFTITLDPDSDEEESVGWDGDGSDGISDITVKAERFVIYPDKLEKGQPLGGKYYRRIPVAKGEFKYIYRPESYHARPDAHVNGPEVRSARLRKMVVSRIQKTGLDGAAREALADLGESDELEQALTSACESGDVMMKDGRYYVGRKEAT